METPSDRLKIDPTNPERTKKPYRFECLKCGRCCKDPNTFVNLTHADILRLYKYLNLTISDLLDLIGFYVFEKPPTDDQLQKMVVPPIQTTKGPAFVGLRRNSNGKCIYLDDNNTCKIYKARPNICRTFPFHFHSTPEEKPVPRLKMQMGFATKAVEYCPGIGNPSPIVEPKEWMKVGEETTKNILTEVILIKKWNEAVEKKKIEPLAENFLNVVLELDNTAAKHAVKAPKKTNQTKKNYQGRLKDRLKKGIE